MNTDACTLLVRLAGPMQSWGLDSRFDQRDTALEPSKSGVIGMVCAALGKTRDDRPGPWPSLQELASLRMGVRVLREGRLRVDFQTAGGGDFPGRKSYGVWKASGGTRGTVVSPRHYLADADFLVGLEGTRCLLESIEEALRAPIWPLSLGRKSYVPAEPVVLPAEPPLGPGIQANGLREALRGYAVMESKESPGKEATAQRFVIETALESATERRPDVPLSFAERSFGVRGVVTSYE